MKVKRLSREIIIQWELVDVIFTTADNTRLTDKGEDSQEPPV